MKNVESLLAEESYLAEAIKALEENHKATFYQKDGWKQILPPGSGLVHADYNCTRETLRITKRKTHSHTFDKVEIRVDLCVLLGEYKDAFDNIMEALKDLRGDRLEKIHAINKLLENNQ